MISSCQQEDIMGEDSTAYLKENYNYWFWLLTHYKQPK